MEKSLKRFSFLEALTFNPSTLSPGDLVEVLIEDGEGFNGRYIIDNAGYVKLPLVGIIEAGGTTTNTLEDKIEMALVRAEIFQPANANVTIHVLNWSSI